MSPLQSFYVGVERPGKLTLIYRRVRSGPATFYDHKGWRRNVYATLKIFSEICKELWILIFDAL